MAEAAGLQVVAVGSLAVGPAAAVLGVVVVTAQWGQVSFCGGSAVSPGPAVVEVAVDGGHPTSREDTVPVTGFDLAPLGGGGPSAGNTVVGYLTGFGVGQCPTPFSLRLVFCHLAGRRSLVQG